MLIDALTKTLTGSGCLDNFWGKLDRNEDTALGVAASARPFLVAARFAKDPKPTLVVVAGEEAAATYARNIAAYIGEEKVLRFPERKDIPHLKDRPDPSVISERLEAAHALATHERVIVVASARALIRKIAPPTSGIADPFILKTGAELVDMGIPGVDDLTTLIHAFERIGYVNTGELDGVGTFAVHGGAIDIYPGNMDFPIRLDFFGDELEEMRRIVPSTGQMISSLSIANIFPVSEFFVDEDALRRARKRIEKPALTNKTLRALLESMEGGLRFDGAEVLLPYLYDDLCTLGAYADAKTTSVLVEPRSLFDDADHAHKDIEAKVKGTGFPAEDLFASPAKLDFGSGVRATYVSILQVGVALDDELTVKRVDVAGVPDRLFGKLRNWVDGNYACVFSIPSYRARYDMDLDLVDHSLPIQEHLDMSESGLDAIERGIVNVVDVDIPLGMVIPAARLAMVSIEDTKGSRGAAASRKRINITDITFPYKPGDYVVHATYGIALFKDIVRRELDGEMRDYIELHYAEGDKLFLPVEQFDKITRYVGPEGSTPKITRLDSTDWSRALTKARKATKKLAFDLIDVYARRAATKGYRFQVDTPWLQEMEESFPYDETPDQLAAICDVKADMRSAHPMDRLICGDVGFGKTEVALRAAFIAAQNHKQVMVLCPTTILAQQHFTSFTERFAPFKMRVDILSRFRSAAQQKESLEGFASGDVNVLIGTHRLLSRDVNPNDLGLVIIDEEQRFGVAAKEQFKNLRESIDVLTLSATPIPRTMQMAVSGVRDMSLILTPPDERLPVKVHVGEWDPDIVSAAIRFELARKGQVYYVSNRVRTIQEAIDRVRAAAPEARVGVAHGKMTKEALEHVMEDFAAGELDVLVATTIIESGIDNPHTNTLIIEDSQRLGLAQMYQLKGRVGRSSVQAYAYFMFPEEIPLTDEAHERLLALADHQELGSGMRIAMRDLEIRGAGNMLGAEQSGNMSAVGFDLFAQMLAHAVTDAREGIAEKDTKDIEALSDISINIPGHMYISQDYIADIDTRVLWYRRIASATSVEEVDSLEADLAEMAPDMPGATRNLFAKARLKTYAFEHGISTITMASGNLTIEGISIPRDKMPDIKRAGGRYLADKRKLILPLRYFDPAAMAKVEARKASKSGNRLKSKAFSKVQAARAAEAEIQSRSQQGANAPDADPNMKIASEEFERIALITNFLRDIYNENDEVIEDSSTEDEDDERVAR